MRDIQYPGSKNSRIISAHFMRPDYFPVGTTDASDTGARSGSSVHMKVFQSEGSLRVKYVVKQFTCFYLL